LRIVEGGQHFLSASNPADVNQAAIGFVRHWSSQANPTAAALTAAAH